MRRVEIPWQHIDDLINIRLKAAGIDLTKKVVTWSKWENNKITLVYEQEDNAELTEQAKMEQAITDRPAYLERYRR